MNRELVARIKPLLLPVYVPLLALSSGMSSVLPGLPQYLGELGATVAIVGVVMSLRGVGNLVGDVPGGILVSRVGIRPVMRWMLALGVAANLLVCFISNLILIAVSMLLTGIALAVSVLGIMAFVRLSSDGEYRGRALALAGGVLRIGALLGPIVGGLLADRLGMQWVFGVRALMFAIALVSASTGIDARDESHRSEPHRPLAVALKGRYFALATVGFGMLMLMLLRASRDIILPLWGGRLALSVTTIGAVMSAAAAVDLVMFPLAGIVSDRAGRKVSSSLCIGLFALGVLLLPLSGGVPGFVLVGLLIGAGNGFGAGINMTLGTDLAPDGAVGSFLGLWRLFGDVGVMLGPAIVGGLAGAIGLSAALVATGGLGMLGMLVMATIAPETRSLRSRAP